MPSLPARVVEWFWQAETEGRARGRNPEHAERIAALVGAGWARVEVADAHATEESRRTVLTLYRDAGAFFAAAFRAQEDATFEPKTLTAADAWKTLADVLGKSPTPTAPSDARLVELAQLMQGGEFQSFEALDPNVLPALVSDTRHAVVSLSKKIDPTLAGVRVRRAQRILGTVACALLLAVVGVLVNRPPPPEPGVSQEQPSPAPRVRSRRAR